MAEALLYGFGKGCDFAKKSCKDYIELKRNAGQSVSPYCDVPGEEREDKRSCLPESNTVAYCNLAKYSSVLDAKFQV
ncbi:hypothetical protein NP493_402g05023 [Ridgeia piscesae]|uniref:Uncharacterized protein n=1 Tax=Ridgeia piscesae TaxID=27915 RepID=A0AAD9L2Q1_RIDPI|nr:hypothetical protein NP493_402g05023 [Ridgeia piscesae]